MPPSSPNTLRLWTIQSVEAWQRAEEKGVLKGDGRRIFRDFRPAYQWMIGQMQQRLPDFQGGYPVWAWAKPKPDLRHRGRLPPGAHGVRVEFVAPKDSVLISDFEAWHAVLNAWPCTLSEEEDNEFDVRWHATKNNPKAARELSQDVEQTWERIFDLELMSHNSEWTGYYPARLQATLGKVSMDQVIEVVPFTAPGRL